MTILWIIVSCFFFDVLSAGNETESHFDIPNALRSEARVRRRRSSDTAEPGHPCNNYVTLNETSRRTDNYLNVDDDDDDNSNVVLCDRTLKRHWYRFSVATGRLPERCQPEFSCGTHSPIYLKEDVAGGHPTEVGRETFGRVCAVMAGNCCIRQWYVGIVNCGPYFVYRLRGTPGCFMAYCVDAGD